MNGADMAIASNSTVRLRLATPRDRVAQALHACAANFSAVGLNRWRLRDSSTRKSICHAVLEDEWLVLSTPVTKNPGRAPFLTAPLQLLGRNADLSVGLRYAIVNDRSPLQLCADIPWKALMTHSTALLTARVDQVLLGFNDAATCAPGTSHAAAEGDNSNENGHGSTDDFRARFEILCEETGWQTGTKGTGDPPIEVLLNDGCGVALVTQAGPRVVLRANLHCADLPSDDNDRGRAIGLLLLRSAGGVRMCRSVFHSRVDRSDLYLEVVLNSTPLLAAEVDYALGALNAAAEECLREVELLSADPDLARHYLHAWKKARARTPTTRKREQL